MHIQNYTPKLLKTKMNVFNRISSSKVPKWAKGGLSQKCVCMCVCVCACVHACLWRCHPLQKHRPPLSVRQCLLDWLASPPQGSSCLYLQFRDLKGKMEFSHDFWRLTTGLHAYQASMSPTSWNLLIGDYLMAHASVK